MSDSAAPALEPLPAWPGAYRATVAEADAYDAMIANLRGFLDNLAAAKPDPQTVEALRRDLGAWSDRLSGFAVGEGHRIFGWLNGRAGRGQTNTAPIVAADSPPGEFRGTVRFGEYFAGFTRAVQGTAIPPILDEILARAVMGPEGARARTAYLHVNFRALTPLNEDLDVRGWIDREEGRKLFVRGEIRHGDLVCADAEGLFILLRPDQE